MNELAIAQQLFESQENLILIYAFNATGKTRLSVAYKDFTKSQNNGKHTGVYYNAFSEDLFVWENDEENNNSNVCLNILYSSLSKYHSFISKHDLEEVLSIYNPKYKFRLNLHENLELGIESVTFYLDEENQIPIKISRGEERLFVWCFFLTLFAVDEWASNQDKHFFIDDPVSSLDEHNIFFTAESIFDLIEKNFLDKKIIITTHHIGLFSILFDKLKKGEKSGRYKEDTKPFILTLQDRSLELNSLKNEVFLFHLHLIKTLDTAIRTELFAFHFVLLRQLLENIASFLGVGRLSYVLEQIAVENVREVSETINALSHKNVYRLQSNKMAPADESLFIEIFQKIQNKYNFKY
ncbi:AAA family ATPase [Chitinophaga sp. Cy-1792]|uniref:AAA family ATPase n=1 Tax=Chitinophaga sp. Cy-1792 TaxID=2608339 RepID=UPI00141FC31F|nr:AAA family ATPase [Chitinophaga sp. Cy-1792]NIG55308.1 AAA family ATPase [Chitinophaga sp. Cy-1792]